ncbi:hypothetical protein ACFLYG_04415, partial [Chloroflexota bacterium]
MERLEEDSVASRVLFSISTNDSMINNLQSFGLNLECQEQEASFNEFKGYSQEDNPMEANQPMSIFGTTLCKHEGCLAVCSYIDTKGHNRTLMNENSGSLAVRALNHWYPVYLPTYVALRLLLEQVPKSKNSDYIESYIRHKISTSDLCKYHQFLRFKEFSP